MLAQFNADSQQWMTSDLDHFIDAYTSTPEFKQREAELEEIPESSPELRVWRAAAIGPQLFVGSEPRLALFVEPHGEQYTRMKPGDGFWTSTARRRGRSHWSHWTRWLHMRGYSLDKDDHWGGDLWRLVPDPEAQLLVIDSLADAVRVNLTYPNDRNIAGIYVEHDFDFGRIAADGYAGVHLTVRGNDECHMPLHTDYLDLNTWGVESTVWLRWVFPGEPELVRKAKTR